MKFKSFPFPITFQSDSAKAYWKSLPSWKVSSLRGFLVVRAFAIRNATISRVSSTTAGILSVPIGASAKSSLSPDTTIRVLEGAAGNLPDKAALNAATEIRDKVRSLTQDDVLLVVITGGGSALLPLPAEPITLDEKFSLIKSLSKAGATINELNTVRIAISQLKGGKLLELGQNAHKIISLVVSDIVGDPLDLIASGPTVPFATPRTSPEEILEKFNLMSSAPKSVAQVIHRAIKTHKPSTVSSDVFLIGNNSLAIEAAMGKASTFGLSPVFLSAAVEGNVTDVSRAFFELGAVVRESAGMSRADLAARLAGVVETLKAQPNFVDDLISAVESKAKRICIVSGGEPTVNVTGDGLGGRNQELALRFTKLCREANAENIFLLSAGTDGIDGNNSAAGAIGGTATAPPAVSVDMMQDFINRSDSFSFYQQHASRYQIIVGHTGTNVMDVHLLMVELP